MEFITFKQFIYTINIRESCKSIISGKEVEDGCAIRIHYGKEYKKDDYIDISWYDFFNKGTVWKILGNYLKKEILESVVTDFFFNEDFGIIEVYTCSKEDLRESLEECRD